MKPILILTTALLAGCENPVDHFTEEPDKGKTIHIPDHDTDSIPECEPMPPGQADTTRCRI